MAKFEKIEDFLEDGSFRESVLAGRRDPKWESWLKDNPKKAVCYHRAVAILKEIREDSEIWDPKRKKAVLDRLKSSRRKAGRAKKNTRRVTLHVAAVIGALVLVAFAWLIGWNGVEKKPEVATRSTNEEWVIKTSPAGQKSRIILSDGSTVTLNSDSEIRYRPGFSVAHREVYLKGEAFFEVAPDSLLAFKVYSGTLVTHALGTAFNIRNYENMDHKVQLTSGKVSVLHGSARENAIYLDPGQELILGRKGRLEKKDFDASKALLWKEGILHFDKAPFDEVVATLERWYGVQITLKNRPGRPIIVSAEFQKDYLSNVLNSLGYSFGFSYTLHQKKVTIQFNGNSL